MLETDGANVMIKETIALALKRKLGREPTHAELVDDVKRILREAAAERFHAAVRVRSVGGAAQ